MTDSTNQLSTQRLRLIPSTRDDIPAFFELWRDPVVRRFLWDDMVIEQSQASNVIEEGLETMAKHGYGLWSLIAGGGELAGFVMFRSTVKQNELELLYGLAPAFMGKGLATEASVAALAYAFETLGVDRVIAGVDEPNKASIRVLERLKFVYDGERLFGQKLCLSYALPRESYRAMMRD
jgi:ribosomal-protein-alanine N-acetyltransferase